MHGIMLTLIDETHFLSAIEMIRLGNGTLQEIGPLKTASSCPRLESVWWVSCKRVDSYIGVGEPFIFVVDQ